MAFPRFHGFNIYKPLKYYFFCLLFTFSFIFCRTAEGQSKSIGLLAGYGISFPDKLDSYSLNLFLGPGSSGHSRWESQYGLAYNAWKVYNDYYRPSTGDLIKVRGTDTFYGIFYAYGRYMPLSGNQGIYVYGGS